MAINREDKTKIRTAVKCYLKFKKEGTASEIWSFINSCDLKLRSDISTGSLASELIYCSKTKNFLNVNYYRRKYDNNNIYFLED